MRPTLRLNMRPKWVAWGRMFIAPYFSYLLKIFRIFCKMTFTMLILKLLGSKSIFDIFRTHHNYQHLLDVAP